MDGNFENIILEELIKNQRNSVPIKYKLSNNDMKRLIKKLDKSIFDNECCNWDGSIVNKNGKNYANFYFRQKKIALNRLLYINYVDDLEKGEYLKKICNCNSYCCNINHYVKKNKKIKKIIPENNKQKVCKKIEKNKLFFD